MNQILTDEEIADCLMPNIVEPYAIAGRSNVRVFARAVESAVLAKVERLLRRSLARIELELADYPRSQHTSDIIRDIREVLGENE
ncbi:MAG: hypothetical protein AB7L90_25840 [Hyphomicrobiaceae bacterium]